MEKKQHFQMEMKEVEIKEGVIKIKGFASTPDMDRYNDIVEPKAFKSSIEQYMSNPIILLQHDADKPIGKATDYKISKKGLYIECEITNDIENVFQNITDGLLRTFSIGFIPKKWRYEEKDGAEVRIIEDLDLIENSVVTTPANGQALFSLSKSIKSFFDNLPDNQNTMEATEQKEVEAIEVIEEVVDGTPELEEVENVDESSTETEVEAEAEEVATPEAEAETEVTDQTTTEEKSIIDVKAMKNELAEMKATQGSIIEALELSTKTILELKAVIAKIPVRKGLTSLGGAKTESKLGTAIAGMKNTIS